MSKTENGHKIREIRPKR